MTDAKIDARDDLMALVQRWREMARRIRPLESAPISAQKRERTTKWMIYSICANELEAVLAAERGPQSAGELSDG